MGKKSSLFVTEWYPLQFSSETSEESNGASPLHVSNPNVPIPPHLSYWSEFITKQEEIDLINNLLQQEFIWEGFDHRRRVQRYDLSTTKCKQDDVNEDHYKKSNETPEFLFDLCKRLEECSGFRAQHVVVEEFASEKSFRTGEQATNSLVTTYESYSQGVPKLENDSEYASWFVAQIPLRADAYQHCNQPKEPHPTCWSLKSSNHWTDIRMDQRSLLIKTGSVLFDWRSRVSSVPAEFDNVSDTTNSSCLLNEQEGMSSIILKFYRLPPDEGTGVASENDIDNYGYRPSVDDFIPSPDSMPPMKELLTIVITTSPIRSNPSTELIERAMETFIYGGTDFAYECRKVIVCDGCRVKKAADVLDANGRRKVSLKHLNDKQAMRNGIVTSEQSDNYHKFKENLKELCANSDQNQTDHLSPFRNAVVVELEERHGYGYALRHALRNCVDTQFVCVIQHDRTFMRPTPVCETIKAMWCHPRIKYVGMSMRSNLLYRDLFVGQYGRRYQNEFDEAVLRIPELIVSSAKYGPDSESSKAMLVDSDKVQTNIGSLVEKYKASAQGEIPQEKQRDADGGNLVRTLKEGEHQVILTPTLFWYDNVHICETAHYRDFIFNPSFKMVARGGFVEDKLSPVVKRTVERLGFKDGHSRFGCFLLDDASGMFFTGHLDGGSYLTSTAKTELMMQQMAGTAPLQT